MNILKKSPLLIAALLAAGVTLAGTAIARGGDCAHEPRDRAAKVSMMKERHAERMSARLDGFAERLALRADQQAAWEAFRTSFAAPSPWHQARGEAPATRSAPERMQAMERAAEARLEHARKLSAATAALYAVLDAEQRSVLDEQHQHPRGGRPGPEHRQPRAPQG